MDVFEAVRSLLAVRSYRPESIAADDLRRIVEAGRLTASAMNAQPWHFVVVEDRQSLTRLGELAKSGPYIASAAAAIVVAVDDGKNAMQISDASRAIHSMVLTAWDAGIGSNWAGFGGLDAVNPLLGIPADKHVLAVIPLGYPAQPVGRGKKNRKPLGEVASRERYGKPFA